jgi:hypothetical protein
MVLLPLSTHFMHSVPMEQHKSIEKAVNVPSSALTSRLLWNRCCGSIPTDAKHIDTSGEAVVVIRLYKPIFSRLLSSQSCPNSFLQTTNEEKVLACSALAFAGTKPRFLVLMSFRHWSNRRAHRVILALQCTLKIALDSMACVRWTERCR